MKTLALIFALLNFTNANAIEFATDSLVLVHASRHYHTDKETIRTTNELVDKFLTSKKSVIGLAQGDIQKDPLWYANRNIESYYSHAGESSLVPGNQKVFQVTIVGGYHGACLGKTMTELISKFFKNSQGQVLKIHLPMKAIFTGFYFKDEKLYPTPKNESQADSSLDGLNLSQSTKNMSDSEWLNFTEESLHWAIAVKAPLAHEDLSQVQFEIFREGRLLKSGEKKLKTVQFYYD